MKATVKIQSFNQIHCVYTQRLKAALASIVNCMVLVLISLVINNFTFGQDVWMQNHSAPNSNCNLGSTQVVTVLINNNSGVFIPGNTITLNYSVDGGTTVSENLLAPLAGGSSWNFSFTVPATGLATCGSHSITAWTVFAGDANASNNSQTWSVQNDCTIVPGNVQTSATICEGSNGGVLNLTGWSNGTIIGWESSINGGGAWSPVTNTTTSQSYTNLLTSTQYRVQFEGGLCPDATSGVAILTVQAPPTAGVLNSDMTLCEDNGNGNLTIVGSVGAVNYWEYSDDSGGLWNLDGNVTTSNSFVGLTSERWFRAQIEGGVCPDVYTNVVIITIDPVSIGGIMNMDQAICEGNSVNLNITGSLGSIVQWESSANMVAWAPISNTTLNYTTPVLNSTRYYRAIAQSGVCPADTSTTVTIDVLAIPNGGTLAGTTDLCENVVSGSMTLSGYNGSITYWEYSYDQGANWNILGNTLNNYNYLNLPDTTWFRVFFDGGICGNAYSDTAYINVIPNSIGGALFNDTSMCIGESHALNLVGSFGTTNTWEASEDLLIWTPVTNDVLSYISSPTQSTYYRVAVSNGICAPDYSDTVMITINQLPIADAGPDVSITEGDTTQLTGSGGIMGIWTPPTALFDQNIDTTDCYAMVTTTYTYSVIDSKGCTNSDDVKVTVNKLKVPAIDIMNLVTMNNDGFNDTWILTGVEDFPNTAVRVFNIYGKQVFSSDSYQNEWDGSYKGKKLANGTYYFVVTLEGEEPITGNLTLLGDE